MNEAAWALYCKMAKQADEIYRTIRDLYGWEIPWNKSYFMAIKDKMFTADEKNLVKEFYPIKF